MKKRFPLDHAGAPVRMTVIDRLPGKKTDSLSKKVWSFIEDQATNTNWYSLQECTYLGEDGLTKLLNCLRKSRFWHGFRSKDLFIAVTLFDGVVFSWSSPSDDRDCEAANNKRIALAKRRESRW